MSPEHPGVREVKRDFRVMACTGIHAPGEGPIRRGIQAVRVRPWGFPDAPGGKGAAFLPGAGMGERFVRECFPDACGDPFMPRFPEQAPGLPSAHPWRPAESLSMPVTASSRRHGTFFSGRKRGEQGKSAGRPGPYPPRACRSSFLPGPGREGIIALPLRRPRKA